MIGVDRNFPPLLGDKCTSAVIAMMVCDDNRFEVVGRYIEHVESLLKLDATESLIDEDVGRTRTQQRGISTTAGAKVRD